MSSLCQITNITNIITNSRTLTYVLILKLALACVPVVFRPSRKSSKKTSGTEEDTATYYSHSLAKAPLINPNGPMPVAANGFPKIPRATSTRDPLGGGRMEMTPNNSQLIAGPRAGHAAVSGCMWVCRCWMSDFIEPALGESLGV